MSMDYETVRNTQGEKNPRWKGTAASYTAKHQFLKRNYGNPKFCEKCKKPGSCEKGGRWSIQWAKREGSEYTHDVKDYHGLCRSCHGKYDWNDRKTEQMIEAASKQKGTRSLAKSLIAKARKRDENGHFA